MVGGKAAFIAAALAKLLMFVPTPYAAPASASTPPWIDGFFQYSSHQPVV